MLIKCKPVWQFQSCEFEVEVNGKEELPKLFDLYSEILNGLMLIAPEQKKEVNQSKPKLASDRQREIMRKFDIPFTLDTTAEEAQKLIQESVQKATK